MPRPLRIHVPGAFYHVTLRGNHRQDIFFCDEHRRWLDKIVAEAIERFGARIHGFCWMTNHIHLLIQVGDAPLGRVMLRIASVYARRVQLHLATTGHLFERRYHAILVDADEYLLTLLRYIHANPVRAKMVESASQYLWSSHHDYAGASVRDWVTTDFALGLLHRDPPTAKGMYRDWLAEQERGGDPEPFAELNANDPRVLGNDDFVAHILGESWRPRLGRTLEHVVAEACEQHQVTIDALRAPGANRLHARVRAWIAQQCVRYRIASVSAVARYFERDESTLREGMRRHFF